jgi:hypothetical protein
MLGRFLSAFRAVKNRGETSFGKTRSFFGLFFKKILFSCYFKQKVFPFWVEGVDEIDFFLAVPFFDLFFTTYCVFYIAECFVVNKDFNVVFVGKAIFEKVSFVLVNSVD